MPLVYAAVVPHAPLLLPTVAKEHTNLLSVTRQQLLLMAQELHASQADVVVILTPHGPTLSKAVSINVADDYAGSMTEFGDVATTMKVHGAPGLIHQLKEMAERAEARVVLQTWPALDYGTIVPLSFFLQPNSQQRVIPISVSDQTLASLLRFSSALHDFFHHRSERFALIASADFARRSGLSATDQRPTPIEKRLATAITTLDIGAIGTIRPQAKLCGLSPVITFIASVQPTKATGQVHTFEAPFGVGMMTASINWET